MDGENNGKPYEQMDDLGGKTHPLFLGSTPSCTMNHELWQGPDAICRAVGCAATSRRWVNRGGSYCAGHDRSQKVHHENCGN